MGYVQKLRAISIWLGLAFVVAALVTVSVWPLASQTPRVASACGAVHDRPADTVDQCRVLHVHAPARILGDAELKADCSRMRASNSGENAPVGGHCGGRRVAASSHRHLRNLNRLEQQIAC